MWIKANVMKEFNIPWLNRNTLDYYLATQSEATKEEEGDNPVISPPMPVPVMAITITRDYTKPSGLSLSGTSTSHYNDANGTLRIISSLGPSDNKKANNKKSAGRPIGSTIEWKED